MMQALHGILYEHIPMALWWIVGPVLLWRVGLRFYRLVARRQTYTPLRYWWRALSLMVLTGFVGVVAYEQATAVIALGAGLAAGAVIGLVSMRRSALVVRTDRASVTPDPVLGVVLSVLLACRIVWRLVEGSTNDVVGWTLAEFVRNPSTMALFGLFSAHYIVYALGIVHAVSRERATGTF